ncbi:hypothetical protein CLAIMM_14734 [Cladophialophora immunda]|nr:hypothetical protein CLAIMM_14734 [Cladophialophora immunda]
MNPGDNGSAQKPVNREPEPGRLVQSFLTPTQSKPESERSHILNLKINHSWLPTTPIADPYNTSTRPVIASR